MLALGIFFATLLFVIWQPRGLGIGWSAMAGAMVALATGVIHIGDVPVVWHIVWDATFTLSGLSSSHYCWMKLGFLNGRRCMWRALVAVRGGGCSG